MIPQQPISETSQDLYFIKTYGVNPTLYMHIVIKQILQAPHLAFSSGQVEAGSLSFIMGVQQLESILKAESILKDYDQEVKDKLAKGEAGIKEQLADSYIKFEYLLRLAFEARPKEFEGIL